jgi:NAD(P)-dependent dehydrogenase (short-subunit alcohol dehydrogenase family)
LGFKAAEDFSRRGAASVILACRNLSKGTEAASKIRDSTGNDNVEVVKLDLSSLEAVRTFSQQLQERYPKIDCLVCNAGVWFTMDQEEKTQDGLEAHVGVNHLAHFLLTNLLIDKVARVVIVSSGLMLSGKSTFPAS